MGKPCVGPDIYINIIGRGNRRNLEQRLLLNTVNNLLNSCRSQPLSCTRHILWSLLIRFRVPMIQGHGRAAELAAC